MTFPYLVQDQRFRRIYVADLAITTFSIMALEVPMALIG
jgi:hypothetical protein